MFPKKGIDSHIWRVHTVEGKNFKPYLGKKAWNKGLNKYTNKIVEKYSTTNSLIMKNILTSRYS